MPRELPPYASKRDLMSRLDRAQDSNENNRLYLLEDPEIKSETERVYTIKGAPRNGKSNVYYVKIAVGIASCTCMDWKLRHTISPCKHVLFCLVKILRQSLIIEHIKDDYYKMDTTWDHDTTKLMFDNAPERIAVDASITIKQEYKNKLTKRDEIPRRDNAECPICFDEFDSNSSVVWCKSQCGTTLHTECWNMWATQCSRVITCVMCRAEWVDINPTAQEKSYVTI